MRDRWSIWWTHWIVFYIIFLKDELNQNTIPKNLRRLIYVRLEFTIQIISLSLRGDVSLAQSRQLSDRATHKAPEVYVVLFFILVGGCGPSDLCEIGPYLASTRVLEVPSLSTNQSSSLVIVTWLKVLIFVGTLVEGLQRTWRCTLSRRLDVMRPILCSMNELNIVLSASIRTVLYWMSPPCLQSSWCLYLVI